MTCSLPLIYKVTVGRVVFLPNFKAGKMSNRNKESTFKIPDIKKKKMVVECNVLRTCMSSEKACDCGLTDTLSL